MRHALALSFPAVLLLSSMPAQGSATKLAHFSMESSTIDSTKVRNGRAGYDIYLPKGYADDANKDVRYPLIVWLHGFGGADEFQGDGGAAVLDALRGADKIPPVAMVVFRSAGDRTTYMNGEPGGDTEDLITGDLLTHLEAKYRVGGERTKRALMGISMGGLGAMRLVMRHPEQFGIAAVHSAAILPADPAVLVERYSRRVERMLASGLDKVFGNPIDRAKWDEQMPLGLLATKKPETWKDQHFYFDAGTDDRYGFCPPNEELDKLMTAKGVKHVFRKIEGGGHAWSSPSMLECLGVSLQFVGAAFAGKDPIAAVAAATKPAAAEPKDAPKANGEKGSAPK